MRVNGTDLNPEQRVQVLEMFTTRHTGENIPEIAKYGLCDGPDFRTDAEWFLSTWFNIDTSGAVTCISSSVSPMRRSAVCPMTLSGKGFEAFKTTMRHRCEVELPSDPRLCAVVLCAVVGSMDWFATFLHWSITKDGVELNPSATPDWAEWIWTYLPSDRQEELRLEAADRFDA